MKIKLLPWRYKMLGLGFRTTSYAFAAAAGFLVLAGQEYHKFAFASLVCALILAYLKISEEFADRRNDWNNRRVDDLDDMMHRHISELQEKKADRQ
jgi:hypothetical protein